MKKKGPPLLVYCIACDVGYPAIGLLPDACPRCNSPAPQWTTTPPYKLTGEDLRFLRSIKIRA